MRHRFLPESPIQLRLVSALIAATYPVTLLVRNVLPVDLPEFPFWGMMVILALGLALGFIVAMIIVKRVDGDEAKFHGFLVGAGNFILGKIASWMYCLVFEGWRINFAMLLTGILFLAVGGTISGLIMAGFVSFTQKLRSAPIRSEKDSGSGSLPGT